MKKYLKVIKKWAALRHPDKKFADVAIKLYERSDERDRNAMLFEFESYIQGVKNGTIVASTPKIPIRVFKSKDNNFYDDSNVKALKEEAEQHTKLLKAIVDKNEKIKNYNKTEKELKDYYNGK